MKFRGLGVDVIETKRFSPFRHVRQNHFLERNFSKKELAYCFSFKDAVPHLAGTFAAKESVAKALEQRVLLSSIEIRRKKNGEPTVWIKNRHQKLILVSISHTAKTAIAVSIRQ